MSAYYKELRRLRTTQFSAAVEGLPTHLADPVHAYVFAANDVVFLREDRAADLQESKVDAVAVEQAPETFAPSLSEQTLHLCGASDIQLGGDEGVQVHMSIGERNVARFRVLVASELPSGRRRGAPRRLLQLSRDLTISLYGHCLGSGSSPTHEFIAHATVQLPVGWQRVVAFTPSTAAQWTPEIGRAWALEDIAAAIYNRSSASQSLSQFDPSRRARDSLNALIDELEQLLADSDEEAIHQFIRRNTKLLFPTSPEVRSKVPFGDRVSDFVVRESDGAYTLVELESPKRRLFIRSGDPAADLTHACSQVTSWRRYIEDNSRTVQEELGLPGLTTAAKSLVVIGRSQDLSKENRRTLRAMNTEAPGRQVLTYDDVVARARTMSANLFGPAFASTDGFKVYVRPYEGDVSPGRDSLQV